MDNILWLAPYMAWFLLGVGVSSIIVSIAERDPGEALVGIAIMIPAIYFVAIHV